MKQLGIKNIGQAILQLSKMRPTEFVEYQDQVFEEEQKKRKLEQETRKLVEKEQKLGPLAEVFKRLHQKKRQLHRAESLD